MPDSTTLTISSDNTPGTFILDGVHRAGMSVLAWILSAAVSFAADDTAKAWVSFAPNYMPCQTTCPIVDQLNVNRVEYSSTGFYAVEFTIPLSDHNSMCPVAVTVEGGSYFVTTASGMERVYIWITDPQGNPADPFGVHMIAFCR